MLTCSANHSVSLNKGEMGETQDDEEELPVPNVRTELAIKQEIEFGLEVEIKQESAE